MIKCHANARQGGDGRYYVSVRGEEGHVNPFYIYDESEEIPVYNIISQNFDGARFRKFVEEWIAANCSSPAAIFGNSTVVFEDEAEAVLFWFTFKP